MRVAMERKASPTTPLARAVHLDRQCIGHPRRGRGRRLPLAQAPIGLDRAEPCFVDAALSVPTVGRGTTTSERPERPLRDTDLTLPTHSSHLPTSAIRHVSSGRRATEVRAHRRKALMLEAHTTRARFDAPLCCEGRRATQALALRGKHPRRVPGRYGRTGLHARAVFDVTARAFRRAPRTQSA
jgi:hypothetical protein